MANEYIYSRPITGWDMSGGQSFDQYKMVEKDGKFQWFKRAVTIGVDGGVTNHLGEWKPGLINMDREFARNVIRQWLGKGYSVEATKIFGLEGIDERVRQYEDRQSEIGRNREARRARLNHASANGGNNGFPV